MQTLLSQSKDVIVPNSTPRTISALKVKRNIREVLQEFLRNKSQSNPLLASKEYFSNPRDISQYQNTSSQDRILR